MELIPVPNQSFYWISCPWPLTYHKYLLLISMLFRKKKCLVTLCTEYFLTIFSFNSSDKLTRNKSIIFHYQRVSNLTVWQGKDSSGLLRRQWSWLTQDISEVIAKHQDPADLKKNKVIRIIVFCQFICLSVLPSQVTK